MSRDALDEIRRLYFSATAATIQRDLDRAIDLLKSLRNEDERSRAAVFMEGLAEMRREWRPAGPGAPGGAKRPKTR
jgi:hypothetical protein